MKSILTYWGGKQQLSSKILPLIPDHFTYDEPFFGGGAVFFEKPPSKNEAINDLNDNIVNFYRVLKLDFDKLFIEVDCSLFSEFQHRQARKIYNEGFSEDEIMRAWSVFILSHQSFSSILGSSWAFGRTSNNADKFQNVKRNFSKKYVKRLEHVQIFNRDALDVIRLTDAEETFHFVDPPYFNSDLGHYKGYTKHDFESLLIALSKVKGKFLLTSYPSDILEDFSKRFGWTSIKYEMSLSASSDLGAKKVEVFTLNYNPNQGSLTLFG